jgi:putrescine transport system substrate-binding protein
MRWIAAIVALLLAAPVAGPASAQQEPKVLNIFNWSDYIAEDTIEAFEKATGIKVTYDTFDSNEALEAKLMAGKSGYDLVVPSVSFLQRQIEAKLFRKLDKARLPNLGHLDKSLMRIVATHDPGNAYGVPYLWGTTGIGYNVEKIKERMPNAPLDSWRLILDPQVVSKFKDCGVAMLDSPTDIIKSTLRYLGRDPDTTKADDIKAAEAHLLKMRPSITYFHSSKYLNDLAAGDICLVLGYSGDIVQARNRASDAGKKVEIGYSIPKEGAMVWFDMMAIPADARHPQNAHAFINHVLTPAVAAAISNQVAYASANASALDQVDEDLKNDPSVYPTAAVKQRLFADKTLARDVDRAFTRAFTRVKAGK